MTNISLNKEARKGFWPHARVAHTACEQALWSEKERRKQRARTSKETGRGVGKEGGGEGRGRAC